MNQIAAFDDKWQRITTNNFSDNEMYSQEDKHNWSDINGSG
jgi:hypothetical protein